MLCFLNRTKYGDSGQSQGFHSTVAHEPLTARLPPPEKLGSEKREGDDQHARDEEEGARAIPGRRDPRAPRGGDGKHENGGEHAAKPRAEVHTEPEPASWCVLCGMVAPVVREAPWKPPEVGDDMDGEQREPEQGTHAMHEEEWTRMIRAGHHEADPAADD